MRSNLPKQCASYLVLILVAGVPACDPVPKASMDEGRDASAADASGLRAPSEEDAASQASVGADSGPFTLDAGRDAGFALDCEGEPDGTRCGEDAICLSGVCAEHRCGDSILHVGQEDCDDGNDVAGDGCESDCAFTCSHNSHCDDGDTCTGRETCDLETHTCQDGTPIECDDRNPCTADFCDPSRGCYASLIDSDGDGFAPATLGPCGTDCNDSDDSIHPDAVEICDDRGVDENCDRLVDNVISCYRDGDGDGFAAADITVDGCASCPPGYLAPRPDGLWDCRDGAAPGSEFADVFPGQIRYFGAGYCASDACEASDTLSFDYNCDGEETRRWRELSSGCSIERVGDFEYCRGSGWRSTGVPDCGEDASFRTCGFDMFSRCTWYDDRVVQECR